MKPNASILGTLTMSIAALAAACTTPEGLHTEDDAVAPTRAIAVLRPTETSEVSGTVVFTQAGNAISIVARVEGLAPGEHGFHIHEFGDCSAPDGTSAGGHFNPGEMEHGAPADSARHVGDLGNIVADETGVGSYDAIDTHIAFTGPHSIIGRGVIVHAGTDDMTSQPTGAAGGRVACGVVGVAR